MRILILIMFVAILNSCDTRLDPVEYANQAPNFTISNKYNFWSEDPNYFEQLSDSVKYGMPYVLAYQLIDQQPKTLITMTGTGVTATYNGLVLGEDIHAGEDTITVRTSQPGTEDVYFNLIDAYSLETSTLLRLTTFINLPPISSIEVNPIQVINEYEYELDASGSFDQDEKYGGWIRGYEFIVEEDTTLFPHAKMNYIFPGPGMYTVGVRVFDSDSVYSSVSQISYSVQ